MKSRTHSTATLVALAALAVVSVGTATAASAAPTAHPTAQPTAGKSIRGQGAFQDLEVVMGPTPKCTVTETDTWNYEKVVCINVARPVFGDSVRFIAPSNGFQIKAQVSSKSKDSLEYDRRLLHEDPLEIEPGADSAELPMNFDQDQNRWQTGFYSKHV